MPTIFKQASYTLITDPNDQFPDADTQAFLNAAGLLLHWAQEYFIHLTLAPTLKDHIQSCYGFGKLSPMKITSHPDNHLSYPGDPDYHPLISIVQSEPTVPPLECHIYQHAIIAFVENGVTFITRMG